MLEVRGLCKHYGGVQAVQDVSFDVVPGECVALIGPNGAGKSSTFACIAGQERATAGSVHWCGAALDACSPAQRLQSGVARTFQVAQTFDALPVWHNVALMLRARQVRGWPVWPVWRALDDDAAAPALDLLRQVGLEAAAARLAGALPYGARKRLDLAMALAGIVPVVGAQPAASAPAASLLLLDEPAAGLGPSERQDLMQLVRRLAQRTDAATPLAVLYTEHNMDAVFGVADRILVLMEGRLVAQGRAHEVAADPVVQQRYLGRQGVLHA